jgi:sterol desaturase/sphingolipid hydroxylase (fatty acid hydroxylase superfamily)
MNTLLTTFAALTPAQAALALLLENLVLFALSLAFGHLLLFLFADRRVTEAPEPLEWQELAWAITCVLLNTLVTFVGWLLWKAGIIRISLDTSWRIALDALVLFVAMDLAMYLFHRLAHHRLLFPLIHATHHKYDKPRPLNLFVLNPFEVLGFGALWLAVITLYPSTWIGMLTYLALNLLFGTVGHLGVEPLPRAWMKLPLLRHIGTSTFHARHHQDGHVNFGFYTDLWDRLFKTLHRRYTQTFARLDRETANRP